MQPPTNNWISYYIYYKTNADKLLAGSVRPLVQQLRQRQVIKQFFFIRYADVHGPHIRLRLLPSRISERRSVMRQVKKLFSDAKFNTYVPETERYGGPAGVPIAEQLFEASSGAVLELLATDGSWNHQRALASALQMHIGMLQAFCVSRTETAALCKHIAQNKMSSESLEYFKQNFARQRTTITPQLTGLWNACEKKVNFKDEWFAEWRQSMAGIGHAIHHAHTRHELSVADSPYHDSPLWLLYESYMHMTNNRLGLVHQDELLITYLLHRSLEH